MADYNGEYGHPFPRVDQYGNPVPPVDQYGNPIPREPVDPAAYVSEGTVPSYGTTDTTASYAMAPAGAEYYPHEGVVSGGVVSPDGAAHAYQDEGVVSDCVAPGETTGYAYEGMVGGGGIGADTSQLQLQPDREEHTTLGETLRRSGSSSSSSSPEDHGQGGRRRRKKKSIKERIKEKLPGGHKHEAEEHTVPTAAAGTGTHAAGPHEKKGIMEKIKEKLPGHHH